MHTMENDAARGGVRWLLRAEGLCVLGIGLLVYAEHGAGWLFFAVGFLLPDLTLLGYLAGSRVGAWLYNSAHSYVGAMLCLAAGVWSAAPWVIAAGWVWVCHIGFDRMLGYGLKYGQGFRYTHLGKIGRDASWRP